MRILKQQRFTHILLAKSLVILLTHWMIWTYKLLSMSAHNGNKRKFWLKNNEQNLLNKLSDLVEHSKNKIALQTNSTLTMLFWQIGKHINDFVLDNKRAEYGKQIMSTVSTHLSEKYGNNFELRNLRRMRQFAEQFCVARYIRLRFDEVVN